MDGSPSDAATELAPGVRRLSPAIRRFLLGLPALLTGIAVVVVALNLSVQTRDATVYAYVRDGKEALAAGNYEAARVCFERLNRLGCRDPEVLYGQAMTLDALGASDKALALLRKLAPEDQLGYPPAHLLLAALMLNQPVRTPDLMRSIEAHLRFHQNGKPDSLDGRALLGQLYATTGRAAQAEPLLVPIVFVRPDLLITLAQVCIAQNKRSAARKWATEARDLYRARWQASPDDRTACLKWAEAELFLENFPAAVSVLKGGLARKDDQVLHVALADVYATWMSSAKVNEVPGENEITLLEKSLSHDPANQTALRRLTKLMGDGGERSAKSREYLEGLLAAGKATATVHFLLGTDDWQRGKTASALNHLELANRLAPATPVIVNNLAWVLAHGDKPDLAHAMALIDEAVGRWPEMKDLRGTRGCVLLKLGRWKEAIPDLEKALPESSQKKVLHEALAEAYEAIHMQAIADKHRHLASEVDRPDAK